MHITYSFHRKAPCHLLRESYWHNGQVKKRTLANLSALPQHLIDLLRLALANQLPATQDGSGVRLGTPASTVPSPPPASARTVRGRRWREACRCRVSRTCWSIWPG